MSEHFKDHLYRIPHSEPVKFHTRRSSPAGGPFYEEAVREMFEAHYEAEFGEVGGVPEVGWWSNRWVLTDLLDIPVDASDAYWHYDYPDYER
ncbi:MAG: hypothetical protein ACM3TT_13405 [Syntrophothermus sp.]